MPDKHPDLIKRMKDKATRWNAKKKEWIRRGFQMASWRKKIESIPKAQCNNEANRSQQSDLKQETAENTKFQNDHHTIETPPTVRLEAAKTSAFDSSQSGPPEVSSGDLKPLALLSSFPTQSLPSQQRTWPLEKKESNANRHRVVLTIKKGEIGKHQTGVPVPFPPSKQEGSLGIARSAVDLIQDWRQVCQKMSDRLLEEQFDRLRRESQISQRSGEFLQLYENTLVPQIKPILDVANPGETYSLTVHEGKGEDEWIILVMSGKSLATEVRDRLVSVKDACLPAEIRGNISYEWRCGQIQRSSLRDDRVRPPINIFQYDKVLTGDSIGPKRGSSATLGPMLEIDGNRYWLLNWHPFDDDGDRKFTNRLWDEAAPPALEVFHPSPDDAWSLSLDPAQCRKLGTGVAYSGPMYETTRLMRSPSGDVEAPAVTDWFLIRANTSYPKVNTVRHITAYNAGNAGNAPPYHAVTEIADPALPTTANEMSRTIVYSVGRTSGFSIGRIGPTLAVHKHRDGSETREWYVETIGTNQSDNAKFREESMGVPGDSGAPIIDSRNHKLLGQLWGRNVYKGDVSEPRITYFTKISTIFEDIIHRFPGGCSMPSLPQGPDQAEDFSQRRISNADKSEAAAQTLLHSVLNSFPAVKNGAGVGRSEAQAVMLERKDGDVVIFCQHANTWQ